MSEPNPPDQRLSLAGAGLDEQALEALEVALDILSDSDVDEWDSAEQRDLASEVIGRIAKQARLRDDHPFRPLFVEAQVEAEKKREAMRERMSALSNLGGSWSQIVGTPRPRSPFDYSAIAAKRTVDPFEMPIGGFPPLKFASRRVIPINTGGRGNGTNGLQIPAGERFEIKIDMLKLPCGELFHGQRFYVSSQSEEFEFDTWTIDGEDQLDGGVLSARTFSTGQDPYGQPALRGLDVLANDSVMVIAGTNRGKETAALWAGLIGTSFDARGFGKEYFRRAIRIRDANTGALVPTMMPEGYEDRSPLVAHGEDALFAVRCPVDAMRVRHVAVCARDASEWDVIDLSVGGRSQFMRGATIRGDVISSPDMLMSCDTAQNGMPIAVRVRNIVKSKPSAGAPRAARFTCELTCDVAQR